MNGKNEEKQALIEDEEEIGKDRDLAQSGGHQKPAQKYTLYAEEAKSIQKAQKENKNKESRESKEERRARKSANKRADVIVGFEDVHRRSESKYVVYKVVKMRWVQLLLLCLNCALN